MKRRSLQFLLSVVLALPLGCPAYARARRLPQAEHRSTDSRQGQAHHEMRAERRPPRGQLPANWMERVQKMSPQEQERFLANNRRFRSLPPERQAQIRARLKQWNSLTPQQQQALIRRERILRRLTPDQRREVRLVIMPQWAQLPPARRVVLVRKLQQLQGLSDQERQKRLDDQQFLQDLSPREQDLLKELAKLKVGPAGNL